MLINAANALNLYSYSAESRSHVHDYYQWVLPLKGSLALEIGARFDCVKEGQAALVSVQEKHCFASDNDNLFLVLDIQPGKTWVSHAKIPPFWSLSEDLKKFLTFASEYLKGKQGDMSSHSIIADTLEKLLMQQFLSHDPIILKAKNWIDKNFTQPIALKQLASHCCLSSSQLQRRFKRIMNQSIGEYWRMKRLQEAKRLITCSALPIEAVAIMVGYENAASFTRSFSQAFELSPSQCRNTLLAA